MRGIIGGYPMANLKREYTDIKDNNHRVEHQIVSEQDDSSRERILHELYHALTRFGKRIPA